MDTTHPQIQAFLGSAHPTFCYEIYRKDGKLYGHKIDWKHPSQVIKDYPIVYDLQGKTTRYIMVCESASITREDGLLFAKSVHEGKVRHFEVDLTHVNKPAK